MRETNARTHNEQQKKCKTLKRINIKENIPVINYTRCIYYVENRFLCSLKLN